MYNIILLTIDCLRAGNLDCYGYHKKTAPNISRLSEKSILFEDVFSAGPYTKASFKTILTGLYPFTNGGYHTIEHIPSIPEILKKKGYKTFAMPNNVLLSPDSGYSKGFDIFVNPIKKFGKQKEVLIRMGGRKILRKISSRFPKIANMLRARFTESPYTMAPGIIKRMLTFIRRTNKPFFAWAHFMDAHHPYNYLPRMYYLVHSKKINRRRVNKVNRMLGFYVHFRTGFDFKLLDEVVNLYDASIRYVDSLIGFLIDYLERYDLIDETIIIITSDHGEEFMEHGAFGHTGIRYRSHLYQELLRIPLIIYHPNYTPKRIKFPVSNADIVPTILSCLGLDQKIFDGKDILGGPLEKNRILLSEASYNNYRRGVLKIGPKEKVALAVRVGKWKYIFYEDPAAKNELYDLSKDPKETINLIDQNNDLAKIIYQDIIAKRLRKIKRGLLRHRIAET